MGAILKGVDERGAKLPLAPRIPDASVSTGNAFQEMRTFCNNMESRLGRNGLLRSAGRTIVCRRLEAACCLFDALKDLRKTMKDGTLAMEERQQRVSDIQKKATDEILAVKDRNDEMGKSP